MVTSFKTSHECTAALSVTNPAAGHCQPTPLLETPGHSLESLCQSLVGSLLLSPGFWCAQGFVCALQSLFPQSCVSSVIKSHWPPKSISLGVLSRFARFLGWEIFCRSQNFLKTSVVSSKKQDNIRKISTTALLTTPKTLTMWITANCGKFLKRCEYQTILPAS